MTLIIHVSDSYHPRRKSRRSKGKVCSKYRPEFRPLKLHADSPFRRPVSDAGIPSGSAMLTATFPATHPQPSYEGELAAREQAARVESERRKKMVAPLFNKGAYQYIGGAPKEIIQGLGRKL